MPNLSFSQLFAYFSVPEGDFCIHILMSTCTEVYCCVCVSSGWCKKKCFQVLVTSVLAWTKVGARCKRRIEANLLKRNSNLYSALFCFLLRVDKIKSQLNALLGQKFHPKFPEVRRPCDAHCGCGVFPTGADRYGHQGVDIKHDLHKPVIYWFIFLWHNLKQNEAKSACAESIDLITARWGYVRSFVLFLLNVLRC